MTQTLDPQAPVEVTALSGADKPVFVDVPREEAIEQVADQQAEAEEQAALDAETDYPLGRPTLAAACGILAVAVMLGGMFLGWQPRLFAVVGGLEGVMLAYYTARARNMWLAQGVSLIALLGLAVLAMIAAPTGIKDLIHMPELISKAAAQGHVLRPPAPFDPGWRPLTVFEMGFLGYCAGWIGCGMRRPQLGLLFPLPVLIFAAISQAPADQVPDSIVAFVLMAAGLTILYRETGEGGTQLSVGFEVRRTAKSAPVLIGVVIGLIAVSQANFLFPAPAYDPAQAAQLPKVVPLSAASDHPLFRVKSSIHGPWRTGELDVYDGKAFRIPPYAQSRLKPIGPDGVIDRLLKPGVRADFTLAGLDGIVLPSPTRPIGVLEVGNDLQFDGRTQTIRLAAGQVREGVQYTVTAAAAPTPEELKDVKPDLTDRTDLQVPAPPAAVTRLLKDAPATGWERADYVRKEFLKRVTLAGSGLPVAVPPEKVADMLEGSKEGSPFEIVAGQVLLERWAGIPARIGYGFDKGKAQSDGSEEIRPSNGSSWLEVNFKGLGWFPVTGAPLHAKSAAGDKQLANTDQNVLPSDDIAISLFIPVDQVTPALLYEQIRPVVVAVILALLAIALAYALWPAVWKAWRRYRRRNWALRTGRRARIAAAYAEFREMAIDLGDSHYAETPLHYLDHVVEDPEHIELAWMVTRLLWGDLVGKATDDDVNAAEEMSRSLKRRMSRAQPFSVRILANISRLSLRHPYAVGLEYGRRIERVAA